MTKPVRVPPIQVLNPNAPNFVEQFREALGAKPGDTIEIVTPQFTRTKNDPPPASPPSDWEALRSMDRQALKEIGLRAWDKPDVTGNVLMLLPGEWYAHIPIGFKLVCIDGTVTAHDPAITDTDIRFGCLAYGIYVLA